MKKLLIFALIAVLMICTAGLSACNNKKPVRGQQTSSQIGKKSSTYSYTFPYITSSTTESSTKEHQSRTFGTYSTVDSLVVAPLDTPLAVVNAINYLGELTKDNYLEKEQLLESCEELYNNLSDSQKSEVTNYDSLVTAREAFDALLESDNNVLIEQFKNLVAELPSFEYSQSFKEKLDEATLCYSKIHDNLKASVSTQKSTLDELLAQYADYEAAENCTNALNSLPSAITDASVGKFKAAIKMFDNLTTAQAKLVSNETKTAVEKYRAEINEKYSKVYSVVYEFGFESDIFTTKNASKFAMADGENYDYNGTTLTSGALFTKSSSVTISAPYCGTLKVYLANSSQDLYIVISKGSKRLSKTSAADFNVLEFDLDDSGIYSLTFEGSGSTAIFAIEFC